MVYRRFSKVFPQIKPVNVALLEGTTTHHAPTDPAAAPQALLAFFCSLPTGAWYG